ncbi:hypothetical protein COT95_00435 [Candidatus Falkowbacteria bacterium CG10_big_fil_rev_8_21_14_0_10_37_6]|uniref:histidine kinase n=1 Tax=Candidatus Falkowbacteria bacterium CG10_big_fil_rev_8_21_14_0_10_37_6 TaxID=1974563 RepID=A0A2H0V7R8_9BACT|nr:MAG: hypothetical protein COT95_00435 [Candidatus Falkowbacteria bacterium CG10_big_fil_rev_8_21_14_0_10_37_6]
MSIKDTGIGIPKTEIGKLFKKFSRAKDAARTSTTGTGLGLYIVDKIIQAHKGRIWAESDGKGKGSAFYVEVPMNVL